MYKILFKRIIDIIVSILCLPILLLVSIFIIPIIWIEDRGPAIYKSDRLGKNCKGFYMYKFRTMKVNAPDIRTENNETYNSDDDPRLTKVGKILRKLSIDELPQIINVLKGEMSIVGPRPNINDHGEHQLNELEVKRLEVRPGITGYNQAYFRNSISMNEKFVNDVYYTQNISFAFDARIILKTIKTVIMKDNIYNNVN